jgi:hypothetical protein
MGGIIAAPPPRDKPHVRLLEIPLRERRRDGWRLDAASGPDFGRAE